MSLSSDGTVMAMPVQPAYSGSNNGGFGGWAALAMVDFSLSFCSCSLFLAGATTAGAEMAASVLRCSADLITPPL